MRWYFHRSFSFCHTVSWIAFFGYVLDYLHRPPFHPRVSSLQSFSASFVIFSTHARCLFDYSWEWHVQESIIYARTTHIGFRSAAQLYIGSTGQTVHRRELARRRKLIQLSRDRIAYYEPAFKIWRHQGNFYQGICIVLQQASSVEHRLAFESPLIRIFTSPVSMHLG